MTGLRPLTCKGCFDVPLKPPLLISAAGPLQFRVKVLWTSAVIIADHAKEVMARRRGLRQSIGFNSHSPSVYDSHFDASPRLLARYTPHYKITPHSLLTLLVSGEGSTRFLPYYVCVCIYTFWSDSLGFGRIQRHKNLFKQRRMILLVPRNATRLSSLFAPIFRRQSEMLRARLTCAFKFQWLII